MHSEKNMHHDSMFSDNIMKRDSPLIRVDVNRRVTLSLVDDSGVSLCESNHRGMMVAVWASVGEILGNLHGRKIYAQYTGANKTAMRTTFILIFNR